jgi:ABC-type multidrug transport system ATPase subunit
MSVLERAPELEYELQGNPHRAITELAELTSRHANDRALAHRAILLKRSLAISSGPPTAEQLEQAIVLLREFLADQSAHHEDASSRDIAADAARTRALTVPIPNEVVVSCTGLSKSYRRGDFALQDVSFDVRYGEILGIVGRNGNGKTTLFRLIVGELKPNTGSVGFPALQHESGAVRWSRVRQQIAYVPQELPAWYGSLKSNLHYEAAIHGIRGAANEQEVAFIIERLGLATEVDKRWHELSGGYKLRFSLARALVWKPKLLILDEPLANLDFIAQQVVLKDLRHLADSLRYPLAVLVSSQHLEEIEEVSDKLLVLHRGSVTYFGPVETLGWDRRHNRYEISGLLELSDLEQALSGLDYQSLFYNGVAFVLTTSTAIAAHDVVGRLHEARVPLTYFRDISRSAKSLLQDDGG